VGAQNHTTIQMEEKDVKSRRFCEWDESNSLDAIDDLTHQGHTHDYMGKKKVRKKINPNRTVLLGGEADHIQRLAKKKEKVIIGVETDGI